MFIRTKARGSEFRDDINHFTNKGTEVPIERMRGNYLDHPNLEVTDKSKKQETET
jgi:hypothetical protein